MTKKGTQLHAMSQTKRAIGVSATPINKNKLFYYNITIFFLNKQEEGVKEKSAEYYIISNQK